MGEPRSFAEFRLPPGRHGFSPEQVAENQRWRLLGAAAEVVAEAGYLHTTTAETARFAGVSRTTFYSHFDDLSSCLLAAYRMAADCLVDTAAGACDPDRDWEDRLRAGVEAVLKFLVAEPALACLFRGELAAGVPSIANARAQLVERLCLLLPRGFAEAPRELPRVVEPHLIAGSLSVVSTYISRGETENLPSLAPALAEVLAAPYRVAFSPGL